VSLLARVAGVLDDAIAAVGEGPGARALQDARTRLDEPLRVAIAGKVKAGKSTLLNALVGERLAPTDAGECTRIVTWYLGSHTSRVTLQPREGAARQAPFDREDGAIDVDLGGLDPGEIERLVVEWPSTRLESTTLIDTPGIGSLSEATSQRTHEFLASDESDSPTDAVLYLMRHLHADDVGFLETFHDDMAHATPVNAIGVLSRADEIGVGRPDAMLTAQRIAARYQHDPQVRRLCQTVVPVTGLLAETASTLRQDEFEALRTLASAPEDALADALLSADRFVVSESINGVGADVRGSLLRRLGVFGVRSATARLRERVSMTASDLAAELLRESGVEELRRILETQFAARRDLLKARSGLSALEVALRGPAIDPEARERLSADIEAIEAGAHEFAEARLLNGLRAGMVEVEVDAATERLLGGLGTDPRTRLDLSPVAPDGDVRAAATDALRRWQAAAESPLAGQDAKQFARVLVRSCEGILAAVS